jgi:hypothetical protein
VVVFTQQPGKRGIGATEDERFNPAADARSAGRASLRNLGGLFFVELCWEPCWRRADIGELGVVEGGSLVLILQAMRHSSRATSRSALKWACVAHIRASSTRALWVCMDTLVTPPAHP